MRPGRVDIGIVSPMSRAAAIVALTAMPATHAAPQPATGDATGDARRGGDEQALRLPDDLGELAIGDASRWYVSVNGGGALDLEGGDDSTDLMLAVAVHHFLSPEVELLGQIEAFSFDQDGDNAFGAGPSFELRWHFWRPGRWTTFANAGIGVLGSTDDVPAGGTSFNFTPRAGLGATCRLGGGATRLVGGVRWHHISNATFSGEDDNPDRDGVMFYAGVMIPF